MKIERPERYTKAVVDLNVLSQNFRSAREFIGDELRYMAVVKADAYGHGAVECARRLESDGVDWFGVAIPDEGCQLRSAGITKPILVLGSFSAGDEASIVDNDLTPAIFDIDTAASLSRFLGAGTYDIHVKVDTGMGRLGVPSDELKRFVSDLRAFSNLKVTGIMSHFASADDPEQDELTRLQLKRFNDALGEFEAAGFNPEFVGIANSPGAIGHLEARIGLVRLGGALYGLVDDILPASRPAPALKPALSLVSRLAMVKRVPAGQGLGYGHTFATERDSVIGLVPIGYADGYRRPLSNNANVIIHDQLAPVVGRISMDWTIVDVTNIEGVEKNDEVILIGSSDTQRVTAAELAAMCDTISYEITCGIGPRVRRVYVR